MFYVSLKLKISSLKVKSPPVSVLFFKDQRRTSETKLVARCRLSSVEDWGTDPGFMFIKSKQKKGKLVFRFFIFIFQISQHFSAGTHIDSHFGGFCTFCVHFVYILCTFCAHFVYI